jgi:hypothetical protein
VIYLERHWPAGCKIDIGNILGTWDEIMIPEKAFALSVDLQEELVMFLHGIPREHRELRAQHIAKSTLQTVILNFVKSNLYVNYP